jgi:hypothetical protein
MIIELGTNASGVAVLFCILGFFFFVAYASKE